MGAAANAIAIGVVIAVTVTVTVAVAGLGKSGARDAERSGASEEKQLFHRSTLWLFAAERSWSGMVTANEKAARVLCPAASCLAEEVDQCVSASMTRVIA
jgi:hypothetical protein